MGQKLCFPSRPSVGRIKGLDAQGATRTTMTTFFAVI